MWIPKTNVDETLDRVRIYYVDRALTKQWNDTRRDGELRLMTGWTWIEKRGSRRTRGGFKTMSVCLRDAYYCIVRGVETAPGLDAVKPRLRVVA